MKPVEAKEIAKQFLARMAPEASTRWHEIRHRNHIRRFEQKLGLPELTDSFITQHGRSVLSGPFAGMVYVPQATGSALMPKLVGSYEAELHQLIEQIVITGYDTVIDVGCAEGYYAIGLALRLPETHVYAFDIDLEAQRLCRAMSHLNGVENRVTISGKCGNEDLNALLTKKSLIVCDCEGFEAELLQPDLSSKLNHTDILVEFHEHLNIGLTSLLLSRFHDTHYPTVITAVERNANDYPQIRFTEPESRQLTVSEFRVNGQQWAFLKSIVS